MTETELKRVAERVVVEGLRKAAVLSAQAARDKRMSYLIGGPERRSLHLRALVVGQRANRLRKNCWRIAEAHGIDLKSLGRREGTPRPMEQSAVTGGTYGLREATT